MVSIDARKRQKRLERKAARRKKHRAELSKLAGKTNPFLAAGERFVTSTIPLHESLMSGNLFEFGMGYVVVSRKVANQITAATFLVDIYCLGVKDAALFHALSTDEFERLLGGLGGEEGLTPLQPACARKLVEGALAYAEDLGFSPHSDYWKAKAIFGDINAAECPTVFQYGHEGKPLFVSGPNDTPARCKQIIETLHHRCGPGGFDFLLGGPEGTWEEDFEDYQFEED